MKTAALPVDPSCPVEELPDTLPLLPLEDRIVFPNVVVPVAIAEGAFAQLLEENISEKQLVVLGYPLELEDTKDRENRRFLPIGTLGRVLKMMRMHDSSIRLLVQGVERVTVEGVRFLGSLYLCRPGQHSGEKSSKFQFEALRRALLLLFQEMIELNPNLSDDLRQASDSISTAGELADFVAANIELPLQEKRELLSATNSLERAQMVIDFLVRERNLIELSKQIQSKVKTQLDKEQREYYLREQLKVIQRELGEEDPHKTELNELTRLVNSARMPSEAHEMAHRELDRLRRMPTSASEYHVSRTYLDWLINLPWKKNSKDSLNI
ncbi:MAG TPA: LON peptidase substrate-binding domain-containing protein, partial [archaeon]|nr:LON peptidase substrate-binding domain-containing protein [archaeon]